MTSSETANTPDAAALEALFSALERTRRAAQQLNTLTPELSARVLHRLADSALENSEKIIAANKLDLERMAPENPKYDRLLLNEERIAAIAQDLRNVAALPCPLGEVLEARTLSNGLQLEKRRVAIGVIAVIFESRPNVTFDVFALCLRSGNACVLKGSIDARASNAVITELIQAALDECGIDPQLVLLTPPEREFLAPLLRATAHIDLAIPRGSRGLIDFVRDNARIPVIETGAGIVHTYIDRSAELRSAAAIVTNAKSRRVSVCNALDTLLIHQDLAGDLPGILHALGTLHQTRVYADERGLAALQGQYAGPLHPAGEEHFGQEFLSMSLSVKVVDDLDQALRHIQRYSSKHSEAVLAQDPVVIERFLNEVDAAAVYSNSSTAFTDGAEFGMGAEIGISTQKLHARGPMALPELTSYKWVIRGRGQIRS